jgi:hypothetical protein
VSERGEGEEASLQRKSEGEVSLAWRAGRRRWSAGMQHSLCGAYADASRGEGGVLTPFFGMSKSIGLAVDEEWAGAGSKKRKEHIGPFG